METPDLSKIRRLSLGTSIVLITLILANVKLNTPAQITPLGIPLIITRPDLLNVGLLLVSIFSTLRYFYYGMIIKASPMQARKLLQRGVPVRADNYGVQHDDFVNNIKKEVSRYFPPFGKYRSTLHFSPYHLHDKEFKFSVTVPRMLKIINWFEHLDFMFPIICSSCAVILYVNDIFI